MIYYLCRMDSSQYEADITACIKTLQTGGLILYPTDTVWGIGCDAENEVAVRKIIRIKNRPDTKSFVVLSQSQSTVREIADPISQLMLAFKNNALRPVTFVLSNARKVAPSVINEDGTIAVRIPSDDFCSNLLKKFGGPIVSTSANISGQPTPSFFQEVNGKIRQEVDYIVRYRQDDMTPRQGSIIIKESPKGQILILRS